MRRQRHGACTNHRFYEKWIKVISALICAAVLGTNCVPIQAANALEAPTYCGIEEHQHSEDCYAQGLICGYEDSTVVSPDQSGSDNSGSNQGTDDNPPNGHVHDEACYVQEQQLICQLAEEAGHIHTEDCISSEEILVCGMEESEEHQHDAGCYAAEEGYICGLEEWEGHTHTEDCYTTVNVLQCPLAESSALAEEAFAPENGQDSAAENTGDMDADTNAFDDTNDSNTSDASNNSDAADSSGDAPDNVPAVPELPVEPNDSAEADTPAVHEHTQDCYGQVLVCGKEEHLHDESCCIDTTADVETPEQWESTFAAAARTGNWAQDLTAIAQTQLGYTESSRNYALEADGSRHGYTRYGDWYGNAYGDWCAMFISFCLYYADIPSEAVPYEANCPNWQSQLQLLGLWRDGDYQPQAGDIAFFDWNQDGQADHVGIVTAFDGQTADAAQTQVPDGDDNDQADGKIEDDTDNNPEQNESNAPDTIIEDTTIENNTADNTDDQQQATDMVADSSITEATMAEAVLTTHFLSAAMDVMIEALAEEAATASDETTASTEASALPEQDNTVTDSEPVTEDNADSEATEPTTGTETEPQPGNTEDEIPEPVIDSTQPIVQTIEGNLHDMVVQREYSQNDTNILGYCSLAAAKNRYDHIREMRYQGSDFTVIVRFGEEANIPESATLGVRELEGEEYEETCRQAMEAMGVEELSFARFFDVSFLVNGSAVEPAAPVNVQITYDETVNVPVEEDAVSNAVHFAEQGPEVLDMETVQTADGATSFSFTQDSFSVLGTAIGRVAYAQWPSVGNVEGVHVDEPVVNRYYIIYAYNTEANHTDWPGFALSATDPKKTQIKMSETSFSHGRVAYEGEEDVVWKYTGKGFVNRRGDYLSLASKDVGGENRKFGWESEAKLLKENEIANETNLELERATGAFYDRNKHVIYSKQLGYTGVWWSANTICNHIVFDWFYQSRSYENEVKDYRVIGGLPCYIAEVGGTATSTNTPPQGAVTGNISQTGLTFYNINATSGEAKPLPDVEYTIYKDGVAMPPCKSGNSFAVNVGALQDNCWYTIKQTKVPSGYVVVPQEKQFYVKDGKAFIGVFYDYKEEDYHAIKTGEVVDYSKRIYQIDLSGDSGKYTYSVDTKNISLVVDVSNSMLFPANLENEQKIGLYLSGSKDTKNWWGNVTSSTSNSELLDQKGLDQKQLYYILTDEKHTATVYALWHDGNEWLYQDASFYAKAQMGIDNIQYAVAGPYNSGVNAGRAGGSIDKELGNKLKTDIDSTENNISGQGEQRVWKNFKIYTGSYYNRLHYLQESVYVLLNQLASVDQTIKVNMVTFDALVEQCITRELNADGVDALMTAANDITTSGGTRLDLALQHLRGQPKGDKLDSVNKNDIPICANGCDDTGRVKNHLVADNPAIILITDGAPNGGGASAIGGLTAEQRIINAVKAEKNNNDWNGKKFATVGLSMGNVKGGSDLLREIASQKENGDKWSIAVENSSTLTKDIMEQIFYNLAKRNVDDTASTVEDVISDSFYPVDKNGNALTAGTWIDLNGNVLKNPRPAQRKTAGQVLYDGNEKHWYVRWSDQNLPANTKNEKWHGKVYLKAKEDFIGGNAIDTNKSATITLQENHQATDSVITLPSPNVNVRLLDMNHFSAEETVFLGDNIDNVEAVLKDMLSKVEFQKLVSGGGDTYNKVGKTENDGCKYSSFSLKYAIGDLTDADWKTLLDGKSIEKEYTYDNDSSHGAVGTFTFKLRTEAVEGATASYDKHEATKTGEKVEKYYLDITYKAYKLGEKPRPATNVHNGTGGPGTMVGTDGKDTLETGKDTVSSNNKYAVNVVDGKIVVKKEIAESLKSFDEAQTFNFKLQKQDKNGAWADVTMPNNHVNQITIPTNWLEGSNTVTFDNLPRGIYRVVEVDTKDAYYADKIEVVGNETNCYYPGAQSAATQSLTARAVSMAMNNLLAEQDVLTLPLATAEELATEQQSDAEQINVDQQSDAEQASDAQASVDRQADNDKVENTSMEFHIGYDISDSDIIVTPNPLETTAENKTIYKKLADSFMPITDYNGVSYGTVQFHNTKYTAELPVKKIWDITVEESQQADAVYVVLCDKNGEPVKMKDGKAQLLKLQDNEETDKAWTGKFTVEVPTKNASVFEQGYTIREVGPISDKNESGYTEAVVVNDSNRLVYYGKAASDHEILEIDKTHAYEVQYGIETTKDEARNDKTIALTVTNMQNPEIPETGGVGTIPYTIGGLLLVSMALMYDSIKRNRRRRGAMAR